MSTDGLLLDARRLTRVYRAGAIEVTALRDVSLSVRRGEFSAILGPSGSGKSTLLNLLGCLDTPTSGEYLLDGIPTQSLDDYGLAEVRNRKIGFVFQTFNLLPRLSALQNVQLPLLYRGLPKFERRERARRALDSVSLLPRAEHRPSEMSGGERQRVAIARALVTEPSIVLADEPTGNLDTRIGGEILSLLERMNSDTGVTVIVITHDHGVALGCRRRIILRDGGIVSDEGA